MSLELFTAVLMGDRDLTSTVLSAGADPNVRRASLWSGAIDMVSEKPEFATSFLGREFKDPNPLVIWTWTPLLLACAQSHWEIAQKLLTAGAEADVIDEQGHTPLLFAVRGAQSDLVFRLLTGGADPNTTAAAGLTVLMTGAALGGGEMIEPRIGPRRATPVDSPVPAKFRTDYAQILRALLAHGADVNATAAKGDTALTFAASEGWTEGVLLLLDAGARLLCEGQFTGTPLMASLPEYPETARLLLRRGADINASDRYGSNALTQTIGYRPEEFLRFAQRVTAPATDDRSAFKIPNLRIFSPSVEELPPPEDLTALTLLLDAGVDPNKVCPGECGTPLITAAMRDAVDAIRCLVERGADVNGRDMKGRTPLIIAAWKGHPRAVQVLLECGADCTLRSHGGNTALMSVSLPGQQERMLQKLNSLPAPTLNPEIEECLQRLQALKNKLDAQGDKIGDVDQMRRFPADFRERMRASMEHDVARQSYKRDKVIKILKGAGATL